MRWRWQLLAVRTTPRTSRRKRSWSRSNGSTHAVSRNGFSGWLVQIVRTRALNHVARRKVQDRDLWHPLPDSSQPGTETVGLADRLRLALGALPPVQREWCCCTIWKAGRTLKSRRPLERPEIQLPPALVQGPPDHARAARGRRALGGISWDESTSSICRVSIHRRTSFAGSG